MDIKVAQKVAETVEALLKQYPELARTTCEVCRFSIYKKIKEELESTCPHFNQRNIFRQTKLDCPTCLKEYWKSRGVNK